MVLVAANGMRGFAMLLEASTNIQSTLPIDTKQPWYFPRRSEGLRSNGWSHHMASLGIRQDTLVG